MIVVITAEAEADLEQIATYVSEQSPESALKLIRALRERCDSLLDAPRGYPLVPRYEQLPRTREIFGADPALHAMFLALACALIVWFFLTIRFWGAACRIALDT